MRGPLPGSDTLDSVPDDDGDDESKAERNVKGLFIILGFAITLWLFDYMLFEAVVQPLAATVDPTLAADPKYVDPSGLAAYEKRAANGAARLRELTLFVSGLGGMVGGFVLGDAALGDRLEKD